MYQIIARKDNKKCKKYINVDAYVYISILYYFGICPSPKKNHSVFFFFNTVN